MVAIIAGNGLGLFNTSLNTLGGGVFGSGNGSGAAARIGQAGGQGHVNASNGNLILQFSDEQLAGLGRDLYHLRTYNAQGALSDADGDGWRWDGERRLVLTGTRNAVGSTVTRTTGDGHDSVYAWNGSRYASSEGDGAHNSLFWSGTGNEWVWEDGNSGTKERYSGTTGRLGSVSDSNGSLITYGYDASGRLASVLDSSGQELVLVYNAAGQLERLDTRTTSGGALTRQVYYSYDASGRLSSVSTDLTPADNSIADGKVYTTSYTYDGSSFRIAGISQSDGTSVAYTYQLVGSEYRVKTVADAAGTTTFTYDTANRRTDVSVVLGGATRLWSYYYDSTDQLIQVQSPAVGGQRLSTSYAYDAQGNVTSITDGNGNTVTYGYDASGNRTLERDALGNTVRRTYSDTNLLLNEIRYLDAATYDSATGVWTHPADSAARITRHIYSSTGQLRYVIGATGEVTEYRYDTVGLLVAEVVYGDTKYSISGLSPTTSQSLSRLNTWAAARDKVQSQLTELAYDYRGNRVSRTVYAVVDAAGVGVADTATQITEYIYSEHGQLLQTIAVRGATRTSRATLSSTAYDGLGRVLSQVDASGTRTSVYNGATRQIAVTSSAGQALTQTYDTRGRLISISQAGHDGSADVTRTTQYVYDALGRLTLTQDPTGVRGYTFYDEAGRISARVEGTGAVVEYVYDAAGQLIQEKRYANPVPAATLATWYSGGVVTKTLVSQIRPATNAADRVISHAYDSAGRRSSMTDAIGTVTTYGYDGRGQQVRVQTDDRVTRTFYDGDGRLLAQLDGEGYLRENTYNAAGQLVRVIRYAALTPAAQRESGTLAQLRPSATGALNTWYYYDNAGRQIGSVDEQGFVTESVFDEAANTLQSIRYAAVYAPTATTTFAAIRAAVASGPSRVTTTAYDSLGRVGQRTGADGTVTAYTYDTAGRLVKEVAASGTTEARALSTRYNAFGEVTGRLLGEASARITAGMTVAQIAAIYDQYGLTWSYDAAGRQVSVRDAVGNKTVTYYDEAGRVTHVVNAQGEVRESLYNAFGEVREQTGISNRLSATDTAGLSGGLLSATVKALVTAIKVAASDNKTTHVYDTRGLLTGSTDALGYLTSIGYTVHGERSSITRTITSGATPVRVTETLVYSKRGELISRLEDDGGLSRATTTTYDAFGRVTRRTDGSGLATTTTYGLNGRQITVKDPLNASRSQTVDAWGRTLSETDARGLITTYGYDDSTRTLTVTTPDGVSVSTTRNRHGEVVTVTDGQGQPTTYTYNKNGRVLAVRNALQQATTYATTANSYDAAGRLLTVKNALNQTVATYGYDAAGRVASRTDALGTITRYAFDGQGRQVTVTEAEGKPEQRVTQYGYDRSGQVLTVTQDPTGLKLITTYSYDGLGRQVQVARGTTGNLNQQVVVYVYDALGRRITERQDPTGLNITTQYRYNGNDQVTRRIDAGGNSSWYVYDNAGRLADTVDALGSLTRNSYDASGNLASTTRYATALPAATLTTLATTDAPASITAPAATNAQRTFYLYDDVDRLRYTLQSLSTGEAVTETVYDANGRVVESRQYDTAIAAGIARTLTATATALTTAGATAITTQYAYDVVGRLSSTTDATGKTESYTYDAVGNRKTLTNKNNAVWTYTYDALGRLTEEITPLVAVSAITVAGVVTTSSRYLVTSMGYDALGNVTSRIEGRQRVAVANAASSDVLSQARTTTYAYDALGRQTRTTAPGWYNKTTGAYQQAGDGTANTFQVSTEVSYDLLGNAVRNRVQVSNSGTVAIDYVDSYKTYDALGRVRHEIDALKGVTAYTYDVHGNVLTTRRHANALNFAEPGRGYYLASEITTARLVPNTSADRTLTVTYDQAGRKTSVQQDQVSLYTFTGSTSTSTTVTAAPTTVYRYNALGQLTQETRIARNSSGVTVQTGSSSTYYYDLAGNRTGTVIGVPGTLGYYTKSEYNVQGQLTRQIEYATALTTGWTEAAVPTVSGNGKDRSTAYGYDALGRLRQVTQENMTYWTQVIDAGTQGVTATQVTGNRVVSEITHDGVGNVLTQTDAAGNVTTTQYNALGQVSRVIEPVRRTAKAGLVDPFDAFNASGVQTDATAVVASPTTSYDVNAFGQVIRETRAAGKDAGNVTQAGLTQVTRTVHDAVGNEIRSIDASTVGIVDYQVDVAGRRIEERQQVSATLSAWTLTGSTRQSYSQTLRTTYAYDLLGQQTGTSVWYTAADATLQATTTTSEYNRFGEVTIQKLNGYAQGSYGYDQAGRAISQSNGQGLTRVDYSLGGYATRSTQAGDTTITTDDRISYTRYNALDQVIEQHLPAFEANLNADTLTNTTLTLTTPVIRQTVDRWGNALTRTDARNQTTTWTYNHSNQVLTETLPQTDILRENGTSYRASLIHEQRYDAAGNAIQRVDWVGPYTGVTTTTHLRTRQTVYNEVGQVIRELDAYGYGNRYRYDAHGNRIASQNALGTVLTQTYDAMDRQLTHGIIRAGARTVLQTNQYDQAGRLYGEIAGTTATEETLQSTANTTTWESTVTGVAGNTKYTVWDERGNIVQTRNESKVGKVYEYDQANRKAMETDGLGNTLTWLYDEGSYGRLLSRKDLGNRTYTYTYNAFGQVATEGITIPPTVGQTVAPVGPDKVWSYYGNGLVRSIVEGKAIKDVQGVVMEEDTRTSSYEYDQAGNRVREVNAERLLLPAWEENVGGRGQHHFAKSQSATDETRYRLDEQGRLKEVKSPAGSQLTGPLQTWGVPRHHYNEIYHGYEVAATARIDSLKYDYDEVGNRRRVTLDTTNQNNGRTQKDDWYKYDLEGRVLVAEGYRNASNQIVAGVQSGKAKGYAMTYDVLGRRLTSEQWQQSAYWSDFFDGPEIYMGEHYAREIYGYDYLGHVLTIGRQDIIRVGTAADTSNEQISAFSGDGASYTPDYTYSVLSFGYDVRGNRITEAESKYGESKTLTIYTYRGDGQLTTQLSYNVVSGVNKRSQASYFNEYSISPVDLNQNDLLDDKVYMLDAVGNQKSYRYVIYKADGVTINYLGDYTKEYVGFDSYKEHQTVATNTIRKSKPGVSAFTYSARGELLQAVGTGGVSFNRTYAPNREGQLIARREANGAVQSYLYYQGAPIANVGNASTPEITDTFTPISADYPANSPSSYVVNEGDTLQRIAQTVWGDAKMWYLIAEANGLDPAVALTAGDSLKIPNVVSSTHNDATTFKPYNPADVIGNTTPSPKPPPPPKKKCGGLAQAIVIVASVVAAAFTYGILSGLVTSVWSAIGVGATTAVASNIAGQVTANVVGLQSGFDWKGVGKSALVGGLTAGLLHGGSQLLTPGTTFTEGMKAATSASNYSGVAAYAITQNLVGQGVGMVVGTQKQFSWASLAASVVGSMIDARFGTSPSMQEPGQFGARAFAQQAGSLSWGQLGRETVRQLSRNLVTSSVQVLVSGRGKVDLTEIAADAFGNALGNYVVDSMSPKAAVPVAEAPKGQSNHEEYQALALRKDVAEAKLDASMGLNGDLLHEVDIERTVSNAHFNEQDGWQVVPNTAPERLTDDTWRLAENRLAWDGTPPTGVAWVASMGGGKAALPSLAEINRVKTIQQAAAASASCSPLELQGFNDARRNKHDALIIKIVDEINSNKAAAIGATTAQVAGIADVDPLLVKSWAIQESGGSDIRSKAAWEVDPLQANVPGDWNKYKSDLGLTEPIRRNEGDLETNLRAGIVLMLRKGFGVSGQAPSNNVNGTFDGYSDALRRYNGRTDLGGNGLKYSQNYSQTIRVRASNPTVNYPIQLP